MIDAIVQDVYIVRDRRSFDLIAIFTKRNVAEDYLEHECSTVMGIPRCEVVNQTGLVWANGTISLFDPRIDFRYVNSDDYTSEPVRKINEARERAFKKLTTAGLTKEEREAINVR